MKTLARRHSRPTRLARANRRGTTMVEFAMVLPVFFTFVFGIVEYGRLQLVSNMLKTACRNGARLGVGADADRDLIEAIAFAGNGVWMNVPGGTTVAEMEEPLIEAFRRIAAKVPPAKLIYSGSN